MVFSSTIYKIGSGEDMHALKTADGITLYFRTKAGGVSSKTIKTESDGGISLVGIGESIEAREVLPLSDSKFVYRDKNRAIKLVETSGE